MRSFYLDYEFNIGSTSEDIGLYPGYLFSPLGGGNLSKVQTWKLRTKQKQPFKKSQIREDT